MAKGIPDENYILPDRKTAQQANFLQRQCVQFQLFFPVGLREKHLAIIIDQKKKVEERS